MILERGKTGYIRNCPCFSNKMFISLRKLYVSGPLKIPASLDLSIKKSSVI